MQEHLTASRSELGLPLRADWCEQEAERLFQQSCAAGYDLLCNGPLPAYPCGAMRRQAAQNQAKLERELERRARALAHRKHRTQQSAQSPHPQR